jgi:hypothetical protein
MKTLCSCASGVQPCGGPAAHALRMRRVADELLDSLIEECANEVASATDDFAKSVVMSEFGPVA